MAAVMDVFERLNGTLVVYAMAVANATLALVVGFGVHMTQAQQGEVTALVNAILVLVAHAAHSNAKRTKAVIPEGPVDESHLVQER